ncbi:MAG: hypothetical protein OXC07_12895 [Kistimonas sp.]|nr:hypothetical protein [Kistimonas sp.]
MTHHALTQPVSTVSRPDAGKNFLSSPASRAALAGALAVGAVVALNKAGAVVTGGLTQSWQIARSVCEAAPAVVSGMQSSAMEVAGVFSPSNLKVLGARTVASVGVGGILLLAMPFVLPVMDTLVGSIRRTRRDRAQMKQCWQIRGYALRQYHRLRDRSARNEENVDRSNGAYDTLKEHAELRSKERKALLERGSWVKDAIKYLAAAAPPVVMLPQLATLVGVSAAMPVALGLAAAGCATCLVTSHFNSRQQSAEAEKLRCQSEWFTKMADEAHAGVWGDDQKRAATHA